MTARTAVQNQPGRGTARLLISCAALLLASLSLAADDPGLLKRGKYVYALADCDGCHGERDFSRFSGPVLPGGSGKGNVFPPELGLPVTLVVPNITSDPVTGIGKWTKADMIHAIRNGVRPDGKTLLPFMPYQLYRSMSDEDVNALVAYLATLPPVKNPLTRTTLPPGMPVPAPPEPVQKVAAPDRSDKVKYGQYLVTVGACLGCHTQEENGQFKMDRLMAGGHEFKMPGGLLVRSANLTPDPETGIGSWTEKQFINRFHLYRQYAAKGAPKTGPEGFTIMPWVELSSLTEQDLGAIYSYLRTVKPVRNKVVLR